MKQENNENAKNVFNQNFNRSVAQAIGNVERMDVYFGNDMKTQMQNIASVGNGAAVKAEPAEAVVVEEPGEEERLVEELSPIFFNDTVSVRAFLKSIQGQKPLEVATRVKALVKENVISEFSYKKDLYEILHKYHLYECGAKNWYAQVK